GRDTGGGADPRACRGARHRHLGELPRAAQLREPCLSRVSPADAALCLPEMGGYPAAPRTCGAEMGAGGRARALSDAAGGPAVAAGAARLALGVRAPSGPAPGVPTWDAR